MRRRMPTRVILLTRTTSSLSNREDTLLTLRYPRVLTELGPTLPNTWAALTGQGMIVGSG